MPPERLAGKRSKVSSSSTKRRASRTRWSISLSGTCFLDKLVGHVVANGERIEERALLKDHAGAGAQGEELLLGHMGNIFAEEQDAALVGPQQAVGELEQHALAHAGGAEQDTRFSRRNGEAHVFQHRRAVKSDGDVLKSDDRACGLLTGWTGPWLDGRGVVAHRYGKRVSRTWVSRKSTKRMSTEDHTTASMVERPTPSVPPVVLMP